MVYREPSIPRMLYIVVGMGKAGPTGVCQKPLPVLGAALAGFCNSCRVTCGCWDGQEFTCNR